GVRIRRPVFIAGRNESKLSAGTTDFYNAGPISLIGTAGESGRRSLLGQVMQSLARFDYSHAMRQSYGKIRFLCEEVSKARRAQSPDDGDTGAGRLASCVKNRHEPAMIISWRRRIVDPEKIYALALWSLESDHETEKIRIGLHMR